MEYSYEFLPKNSIILQSQLENDGSGNFATAMVAYRGYIEDLLKWNVFYGRKTKNGNSSQYGFDLQYEISKFTLSVDYTSFKENSDIDAETSLIIGGIMNNDHFSPYAHIVLEKIGNDLQSFDAGVKINYNGPDYYIGAKYFNYDLNPSVSVTNLTVYAALEYDFEI